MLLVASVQGLHQAAALLAIEGADQGALRGLQRDKVHRHQAGLRIPVAVLPDPPGSPLRRPDQDQGVVAGLGKIHCGRDAAGRAVIEGAGVEKNRDVVAKP